MKVVIETSVDAAGRTVVPKAIRQEAVLQPGTTLTMRLGEGRIDIEVSPREVRVVAKGKLRVVSPIAKSAPLSGAEVERTRRALWPWSKLKPGCSSRPAQQTGTPTTRS